MSANEDNYYESSCFPGGGALGAYEAGTFQQIYKKARKESLDGSLFDIVAGTSIGAINSSVLMGHYLKNKSWEGSDETPFRILGRSYVFIDGRQSISRKFDYSLLLGLYEDVQTRFGRYRKCKEILVHF